MLLCLTFFVCYLTFEFSVATSSNISIYGDHDNTLNQRCTDGTTHKIGCNTCICSNNRFLCSKMACIEGNKLTEKVRTRRAIEKSAKKKVDMEKMFKHISNKNFSSLPVLLDYASDCTANQLYRVNCNTCFCTSEGILYCDHKLCIDEKTTREIEANMKSGKACKKPHSEKCIKCNCVNGATDCVSVDNCKDDLLKLSGKKTKQPLSLDSTNQECVPNVVYKDKCNKCFCQPGKSLLCTGKICLNSKQAKQLEKRRKYLVKNGL